MLLVKSAFSLCERCTNDTDCDSIFFKICHPNSGVCESESGYSNPLCPNVPNITESTSFLPSYQPSHYYYTDDNYPTYDNDDESLDATTIVAAMGALGSICLIMLVCFQCCCDNKNRTNNTTLDCCCLCVECSAESSAVAVTGDADCGAGGGADCCAGDCSGGCVVL